MTDRFDIGDVVRLRGGGPEMTVTNIEHGTVGCICSWFDGGVRGVLALLPSSLMLVRKAGAEPPVADPATEPQPGWWYYRPENDSVCCLEKLYLPDDTWFCACRANGPACNSPFPGHEVYAAELGRTLFRIGLPQDAPEGWQLTGVVDVSAIGPDDAWMRADGTVATGPRPEAELSGGTSGVYRWGLRRLEPAPVDRTGEWYVGTDGRVSRIMRRESCGSSWWLCKSWNPDGTVAATLNGSDPVLNDSDIINEYQLRIPPSPETLHRRAGKQLTGRIVETDKVDSDVQWVGTDGVHVFTGRASNHPIYGYRRWEAEDEAKPKLRPLEKCPIPLSGVHINEADAAYIRWCYENRKDIEGMIHWGVMNSSGYATLLRRTLDDANLDIGHGE